MANVTSVNTREKEGLSLMASEVKKVIASIQAKGLCMARFKADIETSGLDYRQLSVGDRLSLGEMTLLVTRVGKRCHATDCKVFDPEVPCLMMKDLLFAEISVDGQVAVGDEIKVLKV